MAGGSSTFSCILAIVFASVTLGSVDGLKTEWRTRDTMVAASSSKSYGCGFLCRTGLVEHDVCSCNLNLCTPTSCAPNMRCKVVENGNRASVVCIPLQTVEESTISPRQQVKPKADPRPSRIPAPQTARVQAPATRLSSSQRIEVAGSESRRASSQTARVQTQGERLAVSQTARVQTQEERLAVSQTARVQTQGERLAVSQTARVQTQGERLAVSQTARARMAAVQTAGQAQVIRQAAGRPTAQLSPHLGFQTGRRPGGQLLQSSGQAAIQSPGRPLTMQARQWNAYRNSYNKRCLSIPTYSSKSGNVRYYYDRKSNRCFRVTQHYKDQNDMFFRYYEGCKRYCIRVRRN